jgi:hypothetical protein
MAGASSRPELVGLAGRLRPRAAVELREHVPGVHLDGAGAEEEVARDLPIRPADGDEPQDLELAPRQAAALQRACGTAARAVSSSRRAAIAIRRAAELLIRASL